MITMAFIVFHLTNAKMTMQLNVIESYRDTLPQKNISRRETNQKTIPEDKIYCCSYCQAKYEIIKQGNKITIIYITKKHQNTRHVKTTNAKINSHHPSEKTFNLPPH